MKKLKTLKIEYNWQSCKKMQLQLQMWGEQFLPACRHLATWVRHPLEGRTQPHSNNLRYNTTTICRLFVYIFFSHCCRVDINQAYHIMSKRNFCFIRPEVFFKSPYFSQYKTFSCLAMIPAHQCGPFWNGIEKRTWILWAGAIKWLAAQEVDPPYFSPSSVTQISQWSKGRSILEVGHWSTRDSFWSFWCLL